MNEDQAIAEHYAAPARFYEYLGSLKSYSCNLWGPGIETNDQAAVFKWDWYARLLGLKPGARVLELGCGWGGMAGHFAREYGCKVTALNVSRDQLNEAWERYPEVCFVNIPWQKAHEDLPAFDHVVSDAALVHARGQQDEFFSTVARHLAPHGTALVKEMHLTRVMRGRTQAMCAQLGHTFGMTGEYRLYRQDRESARTAGLVVEHHDMGIQNYIPTFEGWISEMEKNEAVMRAIDSQKYDLDMMTWITALQMVREGLFSMDVMLCRHA